MADFNPTWRIGKTILGVSRELEGFLNTKPKNDLLSTLNNKYGVFADALPTGYTAVKYFGIGIMGCYNVDDDNLQEPYEVLMTNMDLYRAIPFRCVPIEQDLDPAERALYRMRVVETINGAQYASYYLKALVLSDEYVKYTKPNVDGIEEPYVLDYSNLSPTPPRPTVNGTVTKKSEEINVTSQTTLPITGAEVTEVINVKYKGDMRRASISEIGIFSGQDKVVTVEDFTGTPFNYTEAIMAQLAIHYTFNGTDMSVPTATFDPKFRFGKDDIILT